VGEYGTVRHATDAVQSDTSQMWYSQTRHRCGTVRHATDVVQSDTPQMWYSQTRHRCGTVRHVTDVVQSDTPHDDTIRRMRIACCVTKAADRLRILNTNGFSKATMAIRMHINITSVRTLLSC
jgi:stress response protein SCP2